MHRNLSYFCNGGTLSCLADLEIVSRKFRRSVMIHGDRLQFNGLKDSNNWMGDVSWVSCWLRESEFHSDVDVTNKRQYKVLSCPTRLLWQ